MSSFVIFDPKDNLFFSHCDQPFRKRWLSSIGLAEQDADDDDDEPEEERVHNWLSIYLTPYVSTFRDRLDQTEIDHNDHHQRFDSMPCTMIFHIFYQEFIFMHLICQPSLANNNGETEQRIPNEEKEEEQNDNVILHQFRVNIFCQGVVFLCGNALYQMARNKQLQRILFRMLDRWNERNHQLAAMIESIEKLHTGFDISQSCQNFIQKLEIIFKLELPTVQKEIFSFCFVLFRDKLIHKFESNTRVRLKPRDLTMVMLWGHAGFPVPNSGESPANHNHHGRKKLPVIGEQILVFLQSSSQIPVPHILRKILICHDLYIITISEISSILMISLPTLIRSAIEYKANLKKMKDNSRRSIDYLIKCIRSMDKYIANNLRGFPQRQHLFNMSSLENLNQLAKKAHSRRNSQTEQLIREQTDRIFVVLMDSLYQSYEKVFKTLCLETAEDHFKPFRRLNNSIACIPDFENLKNCLNFIHIKYEQNVNLLNNLQALQVYTNLLAFVYVDRNENFFFEDHRDSIGTEVDSLYHKMVIKTYRKAMQLDRNILFWSDERFYFAYVCWGESKIMNISETFGNGPVKVYVAQNGSSETGKSPESESWPNIFIDQWFQSRDIANELFIIVDSASNNVTFNTESLLAYLTNVSEKILWHIHS